MLWHKVWVETRWRFLLGVLIACCVVIGVVALWPKTSAMLSAAEKLPVGGELRRELQDAISMSRSYKGYIWSQLFDGNLLDLVILFGALLGSGRLLSPKPGELFTLSLPVSRNRLVLIRAAAGFAQLLGIATVPALLVSAISPAVQNSFGVGDAIVHGASLFVGSAIFFALALFLSSVFEDVWKPLVLTICAAIGLYALETIRNLEGLYSAMSAHPYLEAARIPWLTLLAATLASATLVYGAMANVARRDY